MLQKKKTKVSNVFAEIDVDIVVPAFLNDSFYNLVVSKFKYQSSMISMKDTTSEEIIVRLATARSITSDLANIGKDHGISIRLKKIFVKKEDQVFRFLPAQKDNY